MAIVLHLMPIAAWLALDPGLPVTNESLATDGFIHCTDEHDVLLRVANAFYRSEPGDHVVIHVETDLLTSECVWEEPAHASATDEALAPAFPHVYGPIDRGAIVGVERLLRDPDGRYLGYAPLTT